MGVGNILLSDEGLGVHIINELASEYEFDPNVKIVDGGALSAKLIPVIQNSAHLIIVDALEAGDEPGSIYRFTPQDISLKSEVKTSLHQMTIMEIINMVHLTGYKPNTVIIGIQPEDIITFNLECTDRVKEKFPKIKKIVLKELSALGVSFKKREKKIQISTC